MDGDTSVSSWYDRAVIIPGHANTRSKAPGKFGPSVGYTTGVYESSACITSTDGAYLDMLCGLGAISLGYQRFDPEPLGVLSLPHVVEIEASEAVLETVAPWASTVKMVRTGTEALAGSVWLARKATGRQQVFVAEGSYHGWLPWTTQRGEANTDGQWTYTYPYGELPAIDARTAAVIVEPARWQETPVGYLAALQAEAHRVGALFIVDEMIYGCRWRKGGATELYGLRPDLACYGKAIANGWPAACIVGREVLSDQGAAISGTYSGDAGSLGMIVKTLQVYRDQPVIETLWARGTQLRRGIQQAIADTGWTGEAFSEGAGDVHQRLRFADGSFGPKFSTEMARRRILWSPDCVNVMFAHAVEHIDMVIEAAVASLRALR